MRTTASWVRHRTVPSAIVILVAVACGGNSGPDGRSGSPAPSGSSRSSAAPVARALDDVCPQAPSVPGLVFPATDGTHLFGAVLGHGPVGVVMANDVPHSLCEEIPESVFLSHHGFRVLVFDYRGHGESEAGPDRGRLDLDVEGAAAELRRLGANRVVVLGFYAGGAVALVASLRIDPPVSAVVAVSPAGRRGQFVNGPYTAPGALAIAPRVHSPALFLLVRTDRFVPLSEGRRLYALTGSDDKRLAVFPYGGGGLVLFDLSTFADRANAAVVGFIRAHTA